MRKLLDFITAELSAGRPVTSAVITASSGSTPRTTGSRMAVTADGRTCGTVGGGPGEAMARREALDAGKTKHSKLLRLDFTGKDAAEAGMICGGQIDVLIEYIAPTMENTRIFKDLLNNWDNGAGLVLCTVFREYGGQVQILSRSLAPDRLPSELPAALQSKAQNRAGKSSLPFSERQNGYTVLIEPMRSRGRVIIAGAGHVGQATAILAAFTGFQTLILDDRAEFLAPENFPPACRIQQVNDFADCFKNLTVGTDSLIVIVTRGHIHDQTVLAQALETEAGYIGMIGSRKKRDAIYQNLRDQGVSQAALKRVHCPIGLSINADTPQEIGVSILAELIQKRAKNA
ncbi:xanthine dehydrogenase accessory factor [Desulfosalsimonas propionicica]|uniref:Xanthine dehydrogenase accessory factor n=1 Tax=Desulfosalsimonas propionicica TaxID=332175 RepID=A0A7W0CBF5_9BACT|nr:XdhC/CoxI family protein [Desulfosalsimonas propionicica]MBA2882640.1 xanthine dehydrogenase accessory factor [Desulfosalsimonas propionicica]